MEMKRYSTRMVMSLFALSLVLEICQGIPILDSERPDDSVGQTYLDPRHLPSDLSESRQQSHLFEEDENTTISESSFIAGPSLGEIGLPLTSAHIDNIPKFRWYQDISNFHITIYAPCRSNIKITARRHLVDIRCNDVLGNLYHLNFESVGFVTQVGSTCKNKQLRDVLVCTVHKKAKTVGYWVDEMIVDFKNWLPYMRRDWNHEEEPEEGAQDHSERYLGSSIKEIRDGELAGLIQEHEIVVIDAFYSFSPECSRMAIAYNRMAKDWNADLPFQPYFGWVDATTQTRLRSFLKPSLEGVNLCSLFIIKRDEDLPILLKFRKRSDSYFRNMLNTGGDLQLDMLRHFEEPITEVHTLAELKKFQRTGIPVIGTVTRPVYLLVIDSSHQEFYDYPGNDQLDSSNNQVGLAERTLSRYRNIAAKFRHHDPLFLYTYNKTLDLLGLKPGGLAYIPSVPSALATAANTAPIIYRGGKTPFSSVQTKLGQGASASSLMDLTTWTGDRQALRWVENMAVPAPDLLYHPDAHKVPSMHPKIPKVYVFRDFKSSISFEKGFLKTLGALAIELRGQYHFAFIDQTFYMGQFTAFGVESDMLPCLGFSKSTNPRDFEARRYRYNGAMDDNDAIRTWIERSNLDLGKRVYQSTKSVGLESWVPGMVARHISHNDLHRISEEKDVVMLAYHPHNFNLRRKMEERFGKHKYTKGSQEVSLFTRLAKLLKNVPGLIVASYNVEANYYHSEIFGSLGNDELAVWFHVKCEEGHDPFAYDPHNRQKHEWVQFKYDKDALFSIRDVVMFLKKHSPVIQSHWNEIKDEILSIEMKRKARLRELKEAEKIYRDTIARVEPVDVSPEEDGSVLVRAVRWQQNQNFRRNLNEGDTIVVKYEGFLSDGTRFDSSEAVMRDTYKFRLGSKSVVPCWNLAILGHEIITAGFRFKVECHPKHAFGDNELEYRGIIIPPNETITYDIIVDSVTLRRRSRNYNARDVTLPQEEFLNIKEDSIPEWDHMDTSSLEEDFDGTIEEAKEQGYEGNWQDEEEEDDEEEKRPIIVADFEEEDFKQLPCQSQDVERHVEHNIIKALQLPDHGSAESKRVIFMEEEAERNKLVSLALAKENAMIEAKIQARKEMLQAHMARARIQRANNRKLENGGDYRTGKINLGEDEQQLARIYENVLQSHINDLEQTGVPTFKSMKYRQELRRKVKREIAIQEQQKLTHKEIESRLEERKNQQNEEVKQLVHQVLKKGNVDDKPVDMDQLRHSVLTVHSQRFHERVVPPASNPNKGGPRGSLGFKMSPERIDKLRKDRKKRVEQEWAQRPSTFLNSLFGQVSGSASHVSHSGQDTKKVREMHTEL